MIAPATIQLHFQNHQISKPSIKLFESKKPVTSLSRKRVTLRSVSYVCCEFVALIPLSISIHFQSSIWSQHKYFKKACNLLETPKVELVVKTLFSFLFVFLLVKWNVKKIFLLFQKSLSCPFSNFPKWSFSRSFTKFSDRGGGDLLRV